MLPANLLQTFCFTLLLSEQYAQHTVMKYDPNRGFSDELLTPELARQFINTFSQVINEYNTDQVPGPYRRTTKISLVKLISIRTKETSTKFEGFFLVECNEANLVRNLLNFFLS